MDKFIAGHFWISMAACAGLAACGGGGDAGELGSSSPMAAFAATPAPLAQDEPEGKALAIEGALDAHHWPAAAPYSSFANGPITLNPRSVMQPFKPLASGVLTKITLNLCVTGSSADTVIQIRRAAAFLSPVIATVEVPRSSSPVWGSALCPGAGNLLVSGQAEVSFDLSAANIRVTAGEQMSITLVRADRTDAHDIWFQDFNGDRRASSSNWLVMALIEGSQTDAFGYRLRFKTYVSPAQARGLRGTAPPIAAWHGNPRANSLFNR